MQKKGAGTIFDSKDGRVGLALLVSIILAFALTIVFVEAMTVALMTPGNSTYNTTTSRNLNFTFNATWFYGGGVTNPNENVSNCSLYGNIDKSTFAQSNVWTILKNVSNGTASGTGTDNLTDNKIQNGSGKTPSLDLSYMNFTFPTDGNFTVAIACYNFSNTTTAAGLTFSSNFTFFLDATPPRFNFSELNVSIYNTSVVAQRVIQFKLNDSGLGLNLSSNNSINLSVFLGGTRVLFLSYLNSSGSTNLTCSATSSVVTTAIVTCNATYNFNSNGSYLINASAQDALNSYNDSAVTLIVDQIPPIITRLNFSNNGTLATVYTLGSVTPSSVPADGTGTWAQGRQLYGIVNATDNLTAVIHGYLQFYNLTSSTWTTVNSTIDGVNATPFGTNLNSSINLSYVIPTGHNVFEGANISFRYIVNDTVGNVNASSEIVNVTIQINDTTKPTLQIRVGSESGPLNLTNTTDTTPTVFWNITEGQALRNISIQFASQTDQDCFGYKLFAATSNTNRNGSITLKGAEDQAGCTALSNGTNVITLTAEDMWGNREIYIHSITVDTGGPSITLSGLQNGLAAVNRSNVTPYIGINFTVVALGQSAIKNISFTSGCNSTVQTIVNMSFIYPFNYSQGTCKGGVSGNRTVAVTSFDFVGNSQTKMFQFLVDDLGPSLSVNSPADRSNNTNNVTISLSAMDDSQAISVFGYYLDRKRDVGTLTTLNISSVIGFAGVNNTNIFKLNFTPGTHKIKFTVNDTLGNVVNSSVMTFDVRGLIDLNSLGFNVTISNSTGTGLAQYHYRNAANITRLNLTNASSGRTVEDLLNVSGDTLNLFMGLGNTSKGINLTIQFNESAAVWDQYNFTVQTNDSTTLNFLTSNWTTEVMDFVMANETIQNFLPDNNSYFVSVNYPVNASVADIGGVFEIWYFDDTKEFSSSSSKTNVTQCAAGFNPSFTFTSSSACWNNTDNKTISVFLPHFSALAFVNNSGAGGTPNVNVTTPGGNTSNSRVSNQTVSSFIPNITVSADAVSCYYYLNATAPTNKTMTKSGNICLGSAENVKNLNVVRGYNITYWVVDDDSNTNRYTWEFNMSDTTASSMGAISVSKTSTTATITISEVNESVNANISYGKSPDNTSLSTSVLETDFNTTQVVSITGLTASTTYYYNVSVCDFNNNCKVNGTFSFSTDAAAAAAAAAATTSSSGGGGVAAPPTTTAASTSRSWDSLATGSTGTFKVSSDNIAFTNIAIAVANTVSSPTVAVSSLTSNPQSSAPSSSVYQYLKITATNIADVDISKATVSFKVAKSWFASNSVAEDNIALYRYHDGQWTTLTTTKTGSDADNVLFEAVTPGFSDYAIGTKSGVAPTTVPATTPAEQPASATQPAATTTPAEQPASATHPAAAKPVSNNTLAWIVVAVIVILAAIGFVVWQKKKSQ